MNDDESAETFEDFEGCPRTVAGSISIGPPPAVALGSLESPSIATSVSTHLGAAVCRRASEIPPLAPAGDHLEPLEPEFIGRRERADTVAGPDPCSIGVLKSEVRVPHGGEL